MEASNINWSMLRSRIESLTTEEHGEFEAAIRRGYLLNWATSNDLYSAYLAWCGEHKTPCIWVDSEGVGFSFVGRCAQFSERGWEEMHGVLTTYALTDEDFFLCGNYCYAEAVPPERRELLALEILATILEPGILEWIHEPIPYAHSPFTRLRAQELARGYITIGESRSH